MAVLGSQTTRSSQNLADKPERIGPALAQLVHVDADRDVILGQAWLAAANQLVTCGHVVEQFARDPTGLFVYFPSSGKRYPVKQVRLHPSFVRQPDGMVKFDAAVVSVQLTPPDSLALPLPFMWEQELHVNERLWTIRYPAHLGQFSAALQPLPQDGRFLGYLRKHDNFHLLHDVPLAPGDSGAPITDGRVVVAMHCGDTATLPGLNLPTTSIRLGLWVDAIKDLGLQQTRQSYISRPSGIIPALLAFIVAAGAGFGVLSAMNPAPKATATGKFADAALVPFRVHFNQPLTSYKPGQPVEVTIDAHSDIYPFIFLTNKEGVVLKLVPSQTPDVLKRDSSLLFDTFKSNKEEHATIQAGEEPVEFWVVAAAADNEAAAAWANKLIGPDIWPQPQSPRLTINAAKLKKRITDFQSQNPGTVAFHSFAIQATK